MLIWPKGYEHLDYGDVIYHIPSKKCDFTNSYTLKNYMEKLESVQYSAARAITGAWKGTSRMKLLEELGWETLDLRRWSRRLVLFYKIVNNITPAYTRDPIPHLHEPLTLFEREQRLGKYMQELTNINQRSILIVWQNGRILIHKHENETPFTRYRMNIRTDEYSCG